MLNWRPVREIEQRTREIEIAILQERQKRQRIEKQIEQIEKDSEQIKQETELIKKETEQLKAENAKLDILISKEKALLASIDRLCFPPDSSSTPPPPTEPDCGHSSP
jgi:TolA-binding protein